MVAAARGVWSAGKVFGTASAGRACLLAGIYGDVGSLSRPVLPLIEDEDEDCQENACTDVNVHSTPGPHPLYFSHTQPLLSANLPQSTLLRAMGKSGGSKHLALLLSSVS